MQRPTAPSHVKQRIRAIAAAAAATICAVVATWVLLDLARDSWPVPSGGPVRFEDAVAGLMAWAGVAVAGWLAVGALLCLAGLLPGEVGAVSAKLSQRLTPRLLRRAVALTLGASVGTVVLPAGTASGFGVASVTLVGADDAPSPGFGADGAAPGQAATTVVVDTGTADTGTADTRSITAVPSPGFGPSSTTVAVAPSPGFTAPDAAPGSSTAVTSAPTPGWRPDRPAPTPDPGRTTLLSPPPRTGSAALDAVVVHRGDTLWSIAARHLGPGASDAEIAHEWPRWYAANREAIGADPDLILPGTSLVPPTPELSR